MKRTLQVAVYARVSSSGQAEAGTIGSQLAALRERVSADGYSLPRAREFLDNGRSGATLVRPGLEGLRDEIAAGTLDRVYVHSPDRLSRKYAYQVLLIDEWRRAGVEVVFLNRALGTSPEEDLLLQVQGMIAEYERAKTLERSRRGRRHLARHGSVNVFSGAPYGYRYVSKQEGGGEARWEIDPDEARVVRQIFAWVGEQRLTLGEVCRRLSAAGERTRQGRTRWARSTISTILAHPAYKGTAAFGRTRVGPPQRRQRVPRGKPEIPRRSQYQYPVKSEEWIWVPVPPLVSEDLFEAVREQLAENRARIRTRKRNARHLLTGLVTCRRCGYGYYAQGSGARRDGQRYRYYRCGGESRRHDGERVCSNSAFRADELEEAVWAEVRRLLEDPSRVEEEYQRRLDESGGDQKAGELELLQARIRKVERGIQRLIDGYAEGFLEKEEAESRIRHMKERRTKLDEETRQLSNREARHRELRLVIGRLEDFASRVSSALQGSDWKTRREIIRTLVKRVEVDDKEVTVIFRIGSAPLGADPRTDAGFRHCPRSEEAADSNVSLQRRATQRSAIWAGQNPRGRG
jgi:site-specific DNA recombinase